MFGKKKKNNPIDQAVIESVESFIDLYMNPPKEEEEKVWFSREFPRDGDDVRYSLKDPNHLMTDLLRIVELGGREPTFTEEVLRYIKLRSYSASQCYKKAHIDRKLYSQIMKNRAYIPKKTTAIAFVLALELDQFQAEKVLQYAGYVLKENDTFDLIIRYCIEHKIYDIDDVNQILYRFDQPLLGSK